MRLRSRHHDDDIDDDGAVDEDGVGFDDPAATAAVEVPAQGPQRVVPSPARAEAVGCKMKRGYDGSSISISDSSTETHVTNGALRCSAMKNCKTRLAVSIGAKVHLGYPNKMSW